MKTWKGLFPRIVTFENLWDAAADAAAGKKHKPHVARFILNLELEVLRLRRELIDQSYRPGPYTSFRIYEPKERLISAAPFRDRVIHHALCDVIGPLFERRFIPDSYANRVGKGTHRALDRFQEFARRCRYVLRGDIRKYFPSIDHALLKEKIRRVVACRETLWLIDLIVDHSNAQEPVLDYFPGDDLFTPLDRRRGLPIGNLTSQFFANLYLDGFDHFVEQELRVPGYLRYQDDFAIFSNDKALLREARQQALERLGQDRLRASLEDPGLPHLRRDPVSRLPRLAPPTPNRPCQRPTFLPETGIPATRIRYGQDSAGRGQPPGAWLAGPCAAR